jgi:hypothetical protein
MNASFPPVPQVYYYPSSFERFAFGTHNGRRLQPLCSSGRMARTVTVPPVTGVLMRALKVPETLPALYSTVELPGTAIVVRAVQAGAKPSDGTSVIGVFPVQHSIVTAPADTEPLPVMRNEVNLGSEKNWVNPIPLVAAT